jgi:hypothetical protein
LGDTSWNPTSFILSSGVSSVRGDAPGYIGLDTGRLGKGGIEVVGGKACLLVGPLRM